MVVAIRGDGSLDAEALLLAGLHVDTTYGHEISTPGYEVVEGSTPLHLAAAFNASKCAKVRRQIMHQKEMPWMPRLHGMHSAVFLCLQVFLKYKADTEVENAEEETPLHVASYHGHSEVVKVRPQRALYVAGREWRRFLSQLELTSVPPTKKAGLLST